MDTSNQDPELRRELDKRREELQQLRDEIRLKIHLGELEAKDAWKHLEPKVIDFEHKVADVAGETLEELRDVAHDLRGRLEHLRDRLHSKES